LPFDRAIPYGPGCDVIKNVRIPMRDGIHLGADLYVPSGGDGPLPVVMEYIPYRKDEVAPGERFYGVLPERGYIVARVDIRGTGASEGTVVDEYVEQEQLDGYDAIEWIAAQPWCDGHVNMMGISYGGFTALQVATHRPPHLTSIIPMYFTDDRYTDDCHYRGGHMRQYYDVSFYGNFMIAYNAMPPYPEWNPNWAEIWDEHLASNEPYMLTWLRNQVDGPYWRHGSVGDIADRIACPVLIIGGWRDGYPNPPLRLYEKLQVPKKAIIGPWNHAVPDVAVPGPRIDHLHEVARWLDHWCKGVDTGIMDDPPVVVFMQTHERPDADRLDAAGEWRAETAWPVAGASERTLHLAADGRLEEAPGERGDDLLEYDARVGVTAGLWSGGLQFGQPGDQRPDEALSAVYTSAALDEPLSILGRATADIAFTTTASVLGFSVSISDVAPDGTSHLVAKGMLNGTRRRSLTDPEPLVPGERTDLRIEVDCTAWRFEAGHRIRVAIANADWPNVWPTPEPATSLLHRGPDACRITLPVVPHHGSADPPAYVPSPVAMGRHALRTPPPTWDVIHDALTRRTTVRIHEEGEERIDATTSVHRDFDLETVVDADRPARATAYGRHSSTIRRTGYETRAISTVLLEGTETHFHLTIDLEVRVNDMQHHARQWTASVPRELL
jgi:putative CocE/NonD family hydrolase